MEQKFLKSKQKFVFVQIWANSKIEIKSKSEQNLKSKKFEKEKRNREK
jgi:hypothetical protein